MAKRGKLPEPGVRAKEILANPDLYFAEATKRNRQDIIKEDRSSGGLMRRRYA